MNRTEQREYSEIEKLTMNQEVDGFLRIAQVLQIIPISNSAWWLGVKEGRFPRPVKLSPKITAWRVSDIRKLCNELGAQNDHT